MHRIRTADGRCDRQAQGERRGLGTGRREPAHGAPAGERVPEPAVQAERSAVGLIPWSEPRTDDAIRRFCGAAVAKPGGGPAGVPRFAIIWCPLFPDGSCPRRGARPVR
ncbi:hypothetical protein GCM10010398_57490 [Streptomyces fimbriatus]